MEGMPKQNSLEDEFINKAKDSMTRNQEGASYIREKVVEMFGGKMPSNEIIEEIKRLKARKFTGGAEELKGVIKGHKIKFRKEIEHTEKEEDGYEVISYRHRGTIDGDELLPEDAERLFNKYGTLMALFEQLDEKEADIVQEDEKKGKIKKALEDLMNL